MNNSENNNTRSTTPPSGGRGVIQDLITISQFYGRDSRFVIVGGGNTSYKNAEKITRHCINVGKSLKKYLSYLNLLQIQNHHGLAFY